MKHWPEPMPEAPALGTLLPPGWEVRCEKMHAWNVPGSADHIAAKICYFITDKNESPPITRRHIQELPITAEEETAAIIRVLGEVRVGGHEQRIKQLRKKELAARKKR